MQDVTPIQIRFQTDELAAIDAYRRTQYEPEGSDNFQPALTRTLE
jgi:hypothetical protein